MQITPLVQDSLALLARILLSLVFLVAAADKILHFSANVAYMHSKALPLAAIFLVIALLVELVGSLMVLLGWKARWGAVLLLFFVFVVTMVFHTYWTYPPTEMANQAHHFFKNFAIIGGLLYVFAFGSGRFSLDRILPFGIKDN